MASSRLGHVQLVLKSTGQATSITSAPNSVLSVMHGSYGGVTIVVECLFTVGLEVYKNDC